MKKNLLIIILVIIFLSCFYINAQAGTCRLNIDNYNQDDFNKNKKISIDAEKGIDFCDGSVIWTITQNDYISFEDGSYQIKKNDSSDDVKIVIKQTPKYGDVTINVCVKFADGKKDGDGRLEKCMPITAFSEYEYKAADGDQYIYCKKGYQYIETAKICIKGHIMELVCPASKQGCKDNEKECPPSYIQMPINGYTRCVKDPSSPEKVKKSEIDKTKNTPDSPDEPSIPNEEYEHKPGNCPSGYESQTNKDENGKKYNYCCPKGQVYIHTNDIDNGATSHDICAVLNNNEVKDPFTNPHCAKDDGIYYQVGQKTGCYTPTESITKVDENGMVTKGKTIGSKTIEQSGYTIGAATNYKGDGINVCKTKQVIDSMKKINVVLDLIKLLAPIILVLVSTLSLSKEVTSFDDPDTKKYIKEFIIKFVLCVTIYFLPTALSYLFSATTKASDEGGYSSCIACALNDDECPTDLVCFDEKGKSTSCPNEYGAGDCESILGNPEDENSVAYYAQIALNVIKYVGILLCIILSSLDIIKAIMGNDKDAHKPVVEKTIKRFMYAAILFFVPSLVNALFTLLGLFSSCGIK